MTTLTITKTVDLTAMSDDTLSAQIESNRENAQKCAQAINRHALGDFVVPEQEHGRFMHGKAVVALNVGDLIAVKNMEGYSYYNQPKAGKNLTDEWVDNYSRWSLYQVVGKTAKRVKVEPCSLPTGYYDTYTDDNGADLYDTWGVPVGGYAVQTWGEKADRFIVKVGTMAEVQQRLAEVVEKVDRYKRLMTSRKTMMDEVTRRRAIADAEAEARRAPLKSLVKQVNEAAGMTLLYFATWGGDDGSVEWSYEMRNQSYSSKIPSRFVMGLASEVIASRRLAGKITDEQYALVLDAVKRLEGGDVFATSVDALTSEDDGTDDED